MNAAKQPIIALAGNPNCGKSTVFNKLTGLRQRTGNYPGVTVDVMEGTWPMPNGAPCRVVDLPGVYSLYPNAGDERLVATVLTNPEDVCYPELVVYVADPQNLEKHLLLLTQIMDLGLPVILALNMADQAEKAGLGVNIEQLAKNLGIPVFFISARTGQNMDRLKLEIQQVLEKSLSMTKTKPIYRFRPEESLIIEAVQQNFPKTKPYQALLWAHHYEWLPFLNKEQKETLAAIVLDKNFKSLHGQVTETLDRFEYFGPIAHKVLKHPKKGPNTLTDKIDDIVTHRFFGPIIFILVMFMVFQAIFEWSSYPMDWIEMSFSFIGETVKTVLPDTWYRDLLSDGLLAGLAGIIVFVPQIAILFFLITLLEEVGYMSRVVFMFDRLMQGMGMNGRSVVALISGGACAVPAIMSCRTIGNWKERLITILVTPFISCSARIPVYTILIAVAVPAKRVAGIISLQALVFAMMYLLGVLAALGSGWILKKMLRTTEASFLAIELPEYRAPHWKNVLMTVWEKVRAFAVEAGKVILIISMILWAMATFGPGNSMEMAEQQAQTQATETQLTPAETKNLVASQRLEASYAGILGKTIEPAIRPLGYDWKIGIALITSFAAREVFVGTMSTIYSLGEDSEDEGALRAKMRSAKYYDTEKPVYTFATAMSLLVFYALAMQCMSTLAVVKRETNSWKWPILQFFAMTIIAYLASFLVYQYLS